MQLGAHEAAELNELLMSCTNSIQSMALFINEATDPELRTMIQRHYSAHVQDYNMKVEFATQQMGSRDRLNVPAMDGQLAVTPAGQYQPIQPQVKLTRLDDRAIATNYLLTLKRAGREYAWSAFETTTPQMRAFLEDAFRMCSHQSYEVWQYMVKKGWYPLTMAAPQAMQAMGTIYQQVPYQQPMAVYGQQ